MGSDALVAEVFVLHYSDKKRDGKWHSLGKCPKNWKQDDKDMQVTGWVETAANSYGRPCKVVFSDGTEITIQPREEAV